MLHELETRIINAYLSKEITLLEKQAALLVAAKFVALHLEKSAELFTKNKI